MKPKLLVLLSPLGEAMARDVAETCSALDDAYDVLALVPASEHARFDRFALSTDFRASGIIGMGRSIAQLRRVVERFAPDVVHAHGFPATSVALGTFPLALARRTVVTFHDPMRDKELPTKLVDRRFPGYLDRAAGVTATYPSLARSLEERFGLAPDRIVVVPHGVDDALGAVELARPGGRPGPIVGWSGSLAADRAWETAIEAFEKVRASLPDARLTIAGDGRARQFVAALVRRQNLANVVRFAGRVRARELFAEIDVLVVPISRDAQPHNVLEGLAAGIPVVASNGGALADAVGDFETGWLVDDDAAGIALGVETVWSNVDEAWRGAGAQREEARIRYGRAHAVAAYERIYRAIPA